VAASVEVTKRLVILTMVEPSSSLEEKSISSNVLTIPLARAGRSDIWFFRYKLETKARDIRQAWVNAWITQA
jgi:hypothetical protein